MLTELINQDEEKTAVFSNIFKKDEGDFLF